MKNLALVCCLLGGCSTTVNLTVTNPSTQAQTATVNITSSSGIPQTSIGLGTIQPNGTATSTFKVDHGGSFTTQAAVAAGNLDWSSGSISVYKDPDPLTKSLAIVPAGQQIPPGIEKLVNDLQMLGDYYGFVPISKNSALNTVLGALVCYSRPTDPAAKISPFLTLPPGVLSDKTQQVDFVYNQRSDNDTLAFAEHRGGLNAAGSVGERRGQAACS
jgi:hypothetical protein